MDWNSLMITELFDVMTINVEKGVRRQITNRKGYGISFCSTPGGKIVYSHNGKQFVSDANHAIFLPRGQTYVLYGVETGDFPLINFYCDAAFSQPEFETFPVANLNVYLRYYSMIKTICLYPHPVYRMQAFSLLYQILEQLLIDNDNSKQLQILRPAIDYLEGHFADPKLSVDMLADQAHISVTYFRRLFKSAYAIAPKQYILNVRIAKAKELLRSSHYLIAAISADCGFGDECHFSRVFKSYVGASPSEYRNKCSQIL